MSHHTTINTTAHPDTLYDAIVDGLENAGIDNYEINDGHTRREWTAALRWCAGRIDMERGQARGWEITQDASIWASLIEAGELTPWAETPADPPRIAVEPPAAPDPASGMGAAAPGPETAAEGLCRCGLPLPCPRHGQMEPPGSREVRSAIAAARREAAAATATHIAHAHIPQGTATWDLVMQLADDLGCGEVPIPTTTEERDHDDH